MGRFVMKFHRLLNNLSHVFFVIVVFGAFVCGATGAAHAACSANEIDVLGDGTQCETAKFTLTTTEFTGVSSYNWTFDFYVSAKGTFYIDCGVDGLLYDSTSTGATPLSTTVVRNNTSKQQYQCRYSSKGVKTIRFGGVATAYSTTNATAAFAFGSGSYYTSPKKIASISGSLASLFPQLGTSDGQIPQFYETFRYAENLTSIPDTLFYGLTGGRDYMFYGTFADCDALTDIPSNLFEGITASADWMFYRTFENCESLTAIPENLFSGITTAASQLFGSVFSGCTSLSGYIPPSTFAGLIANGHPSDTGMWAQSFYRTALASSCSPYDRVQFVTGYEGFGGNYGTKWESVVSCGCHVGYYGDGVNCTVCPAGAGFYTGTTGTTIPSVDNGSIGSSGTAITQCYAKESTTFHDDRGTFTFSPNCYYTE